MRTTWTFKAWICGTALCLANCDLNDPHDAEGESGVVRGRLLKEVSNTEAEKLCAFEAAEFGKAWTSEETYCAVFSGDSLELTCDEQYAECVASDEFETLTTREPRCDGFSKSRFVWGDDCDATVGDWEACVQTVYRAMNDFYEGADCQSIAGSEDGAPRPAACTELEKKCKNLGGSNANAE